MNNLNDNNFYFKKGDTELTTLINYFAPGEYMVEINKVEKVNSKSRAGIIQLKIYFSIMKENVSIATIAYFPEDKTKKLNELLCSLNMENLYKSSSLKITDLIGKTTNAIIDIDEYEDKNGNKVKRNKIVKFLQPWKETDNQAHESHLDADIPF